MNNASRILSDVVSIDGWIGSFGDDNTASVHVDVVFRTAYLGGQPSDKIRFSLELKRAEVVVCIPQHEPLKVRRESVARTICDTETVRETTTRQTLSGEATASGTLASESLPKGQVTAGGKVSGERETLDKRSEAVRDFLVQHFKTPDGDFGFEVRSSTRDKVLSGTPWDARNAPRLEVVRSAERNADGDKPTVRIELRCRRQDLYISGLEPKDPKLKKTLLRDNSDLRIAAAEQVIKEEICRAGFLPLPDLSEKHSEVLVADLIITEDV